MNEIFVCLKWAFYENEPDDLRYASMSPADEAALELALRMGERTGSGVAAVCVGPKGAERVLRDALACGATTAIRIAAPAAPGSAVVAANVAALATNAAWVFCGDYSLDNGGGCVPAFIAAELRAQQALGLIEVSFAADHVECTRRLDGGRRETIKAQAPAVLSVEGATAQLRRGGLAALRSAATTAIKVVAMTGEVAIGDRAISPYRPRARALAGPVGERVLDRVRSLTASTSSAARPEVETLDPTDAAARIVGALRDWGYL